MIRLALAALAFALPVSAAAQDHAYAVGQVWEYEEAPGDEGSLIKIQQIETIGPPDDPFLVYHISIIGLDFSDFGIPDEVQHVPVSVGSLDMSVTLQHTGDATFPDHSEGVRMWHEANGGVFTISLAEIVGIVREQIGPQMQRQTKSIK
ncbi:hypothetical protein [Erythrobacter sp. EC-HK427]|uniref:hypothetical protein n=1 Tax=Erythrobacter sp. EC-HK427 TaxID=2038396 RepID=UPI00125B3C65|nr:hypothetical protein [Erythrobacter sp. EC-HK427]VVS98759.1 conserved exported hypothetical protein [Erythrobacter sp. EC-HK427]